MRAACCKACVAACAPLCSPPPLFLSPQASPPTGPPARPSRRSSAGGAACRWRQRGRDAASTRQELPCVLACVARCQCLWLSRLGSCLTSAPPAVGQHPSAHACLTAYPSCSPSSLCRSREQVKAEGLALKGCCMYFANLTKDQEERSRVGGRVGGCVDAWPVGRTCGQGQGRQRTPGECFVVLRLSAATLLSGEAGKGSAHAAPRIPKRCCPPPPPPSPPPSDPRAPHGRRRLARALQPPHAGARRCPARAVGPALRVHARRGRWQGGRTAASRLFVWVLQNEAECRRLCAHKGVGSACCQACAPRLPLPCPAHLPARPPTHRPTHPPLLPTAGGPAPYGRRAEWALVLQSGCDVLSIRWLGRCYAEGALVEPAASEYLRISEATLKVGHLPPVGCLHSRPSAAFTAAARAPQESPRRPRPWWPARSQRSAGSPQLGPVRRRLLRRGERGAHASCSALCCCTACHAYCLFVVADCPDRGDMACSPSAAADKHGTASSSLPQPHHHHPTPPHPTPPD